MARLATRRRAALVALLAGALALAACGDLAGAEIGGPTGSAVFTGSVTDGTAQLAYDPDWPTAGDGLWQVGTEADGSPDTLELQLERMGDAFPLERYVEQSIAGATKTIPGVSVLSQEPITLASGTRAVRIVLGTEAPPARRFLVIAAVRGVTGAAVVLIASSGRFDALARDVEPYARTLRFV